MKKWLTGMAVMASVWAMNAQDFKIKKGEIQIGKQTVAKIDKQKEGFKISSLDGETWFIIHTTNVTDAKNIAPKYWLELKGANGNLREVEYGEVSFSFSKEKWNVEALFKSELGLVTAEGVDKVKVDKFFETADRKVSAKWNKFIKEQSGENAKEDDLAKEQQLEISISGTIKRGGETVGSFKKETVNAQIPSYSYTVYNSKNAKVGTVVFYEQENLNNSNNGFTVKLANKETVNLFGVIHSFNKIDSDSLLKRMVYKLNAMELLE